MLKLKYTVERNTHHMELLLLCIKLFCARIIDVTIGTVRTVYIIKEKRIVASILAFIEVLIWFVVVKEALSTEINSIFIPIAYAAGFATGTYIGTFISTKYIKGHLTLNIISAKINEKDILCLREYGFGVSTLKLADKKKMLIIEIDKKRLRQLENVLLAMDKHAFIIINESKFVHNGFIK